MVKVSVVIPVYNVEQYLSKCIDSVLSQTLTDIEVLLVNDGSTDCSLDICQKYAELDDRICVLNKTNGGLSSARNYGIEHSNGEYLIFLDSDDFWINNDILLEFYKKAKANDLDVVRAEYIYVNEVGDIPTKQTIAQDKILFKDRCLDSYQMVKDVIHGENFAVLFFVKRASLGMLRFNEERKFQEDIDMVIKYFSLERTCGYLPLQFYAYRRRDNSITTTPRIVNIIDSFSFCDMYYEYSLKIRNKDLADLYIYYSIMMYQWTLESVASKDYYSRYTEIDRQVNLVKLRKRVRDRIKLVNQKKFPLQIYVSPYLGIKLFHLRWNIGKMMRFFLIK